MSKRLIGPFLFPRQTSLDELQPVIKSRGLSRSFPRDKGATTTPLTLIIISSRVGSLQSEYPLRPMLFRSSATYLSYRRCRRLTIATTKTIGLPCDFPPFWRKGIFENGIRGQVEWSCDRVSCRKLRVGCEPFARSFCGFFPSDEDNRRYSYPLIEFCMSSLRNNDSSCNLVSVWPEFSKKRLPGLTPLQRNKIVKYGGRRISTDWTVQRYLLYYFCH